MSIPAIVLAAALAINVIDGDTLEIDGEMIRIANIDAPELHDAKCDAERRLAIVAKDVLARIVVKPGLVVTRGWEGRLLDPYGRTLATLSVNGQDIGDIMVKGHLARKWAGKRRPWCVP